jgi:hypothetical protein
LILEALAKVVMDDRKDTTPAAPPATGERPPTKADLVDAIVAAATNGLFTGDKRDGGPPPITYENFHLKAFRYGARKLRKRLERLPDAEFWGELEATVGYVDALKENREYATALLRDADLRALSERQSEVAQQPRGQLAIFAAARHYRAQRVTAKQAWEAINKAPFVTGDGAAVKVEGPKPHERMRVTLPDGRQERRQIGFEQWRQHYWPRCMLSQAKHTPERKLSRAKRTPDPIP